MCSFVYTLLCFGCLVCVDWGSFNFPSVHIERQMCWHLEFASSLIQNVRLQLSLRHSRDTHVVLIFPSDMSRVIKESLAANLSPLWFFTAHNEYCKLNLDNVRELEAENCEREPTVWLCKLWNSFCFSDKRTSLIYFDVHIDVAHCPVIKIQHFLPNVYTENTVKMSQTSLWEFITWPLILKHLNSLFQGCGVDPKATHLCTLEQVLLTRNQDFSLSVLPFLNIQWLSEEQKQESYECKSNHITIFCLLIRQS